MLRRPLTIATPLVALALVAFTLVPVSEAVPRRASLAAVSIRRAQPLCPQRGLYRVGPRILPMLVPPQSPQRPSAPLATVVPPVRSAYRAWVWRGEIVIRTYTGCGQRTLGSFDVYRVTVGPLMAPGTGSAAGMPCQAPCNDSLAGIVHATGTFAQDATHLRDPSSVVVTATLFTVRPGPALGRPCSTQTGCPPSVVITATVTLRHVIARLRTDRMGRHASLSFRAQWQKATLPATTIVLYGYRVTAPLPVPTPRQYLAPREAPATLQRRVAV